MNFLDQKKLKFLESKFGVCSYFPYKVENFRFHFSLLKLFFFYSLKIMSIVIFHSVTTFQRYQICQIVLNTQKTKKA